MMARVLIIINFWTQKDFALYKMFHKYISQAEAKTIAKRQVEFDISMGVQIYVTCVTCYWKKWNAMKKEKKMPCLNKCVKGFNNYNYKSMEWFI